ncbi:MAG TPA: hypothetical protein VE076_13580 [Nitrososphaeraceae archaeon]|nr:hypothetical protein [Nitrososphaeraceae archaeon]
MKGKKSENNNSTKKQNRTSKGSRQNNGNDSPYMTVKKRPQVGKKTKPLENKEQQQQISIKRSSGRKEKFDTNRMAQTVGRSGVPFLMARDVAKKVSGKIKQEAYDQQSKGKDNSGNGKSKLSAQLKKGRTVTGSKVRNMVANELRDRNRGGIAASYSGQVPENTLPEENLKDKQPVADSVAANRNRVLHDESKMGGGIMT